VDGAIGFLQIIVFKGIFADSKSSILFPLFIPFSSVRDLTRKSEEAKKNCFPAAYGGPYPPFASLTAPRASRGLKGVRSAHSFRLGASPQTPVRGNE
jgi:hypothetical protein